MAFAVLSQFKRQVIDELDPDGSALQTALKGTILGLSALLLNMVVPFVQDFWIIAGSIILLLTNLGESRLKRFLNVLFAGLFATVGVFLATVAGLQLYQLLIVMFVLAFVAGFVARFGKNIAVAAVVGFVLTLFAGGMPADLSAALLRSASIFCAMLLSMIMIFVIFPGRAQYKLYDTIMLALRQMSEYFFHTMTDALRGNHLRFRHGKIKLILLLFMDQNRLLKRELHKKSEKLSWLFSLLDAEEELLEAMFSLANILTSPSNNEVFSSILPQLQQFAIGVSQFFAIIKAPHRHQKIPAGIEDFTQTNAEINAKIEARLKEIMQTENLYQWPVDIAHLRYVLNRFQDALLGIAEVLQNRVEKKALT